MRRYGIWRERDQGYKRRETGDERDARETVTRDARDEKRERE